MEKEVKTTEDTLNSVVFQAFNSQGTIDSLVVDGAAIDSMFFQEKDIEHNLEPFAFVMFKNDLERHALFVSENDFDPEIVPAYDFLYSMIDYDRIQVNLGEQSVRMTFEGNKRVTEADLPEFNEDVIDWELASVFVNVFSNEKDEVLVVFGTPQGVKNNEDIIEQIFSYFGKDK